MSVDPSNFGVGPFSSGKKKPLAIFKEKEIQAEKERKKKEKRRKKKKKKKKKTKTKTKEKVNANPKRMMMSSKKNIYGFFGYLVGFLLVC